MSLSVVNFGLKAGKTIKNVDVKSIGLPDSSSCNLSGAVADLKLHAYLVDYFDYSTTKNSSYLNYSLGKRQSLFKTAGLNSSDENSCHVKDVKLYALSAKRSDVAEENRSFTVTSGVPAFNKRHGCCLLSSETVTVPQTETPEWLEVMSYDTASLFADDEPLGNKLDQMLFSLFVSRAHFNNFGLPGIVQFRLEMHVTQMITPVNMINNRISYLGHSTERDLSPLELVSMSVSLHSVSSESSF
jgi:hypothetical protein